jgi:hypothetical protein
MSPTWRCAGQRVAGGSEALRSDQDECRRPCPPRSSTGIAWTAATWNPLQGRTRVSKGCDACYAVTLIATRMAGLYPGLARIKTAEDGTKSCAFAWVIHNDSPGLTTFPVGRLNSAA